MAEAPLRELAHGKTKRRPPVVRQVARMVKSQTARPPLCSVGLGKGLVSVSSTHAARYEQEKCLFRDIIAYVSSA